MSPLLSIIIPCYNMGEFLPEAVESVLQYPNLEQVEIIIVNDGSTDSTTIRVLEEIDRKYPFIQVLNQQNQGLAKARNNGIKLSKGEYILPLDADNKIRPVYISESITIFENNKDIDIVYGDKQLFGNKNQAVEVPDFNFPKLCKSNYIDACAVYRKSVWKKNGGYDENMPVMGYEDWDFWLRAALCGAKYHHLNKICFDYRVRDNSMITETNKNYNLLIQYMHQKKELNAVKQIIEVYDEAIKYKQLINSRSYKIYIKLMKLFRKIKIG